MSEIKSPFLVYQEFLSPKLCEIVLNNVKVSEPDKDADGFPIKMERFDDESENIIFSKFQELVPELESHYNLKYKGTEKLVFQHYPDGMNGPAEQPHCESSKYLRKKWVKVQPRDLTAVLWLKDYNDTPPVEQRTEVYGGKLEFPAYNFSLVPQRGTLVVYPAGPHFISAISPVLVGGLYQVRFHIAAEGIFLYQPENFKGGYQQWFEQYA